MRLSDSLAVGLLSNLRKTLDNIQDTASTREDALYLDAKETVYTLPSYEDYSWSALVYGNGKFLTIARARGVNAIACSYDGLVWNIVEGCMPEASSSFSGLVYGNGVFLASVALGSSSIYYSYDGVTWMETSFGVRGTIYALDWCNDKFLAYIRLIAADTYAFMYSYNGIDWVIGSDTEDDKNISKFFYINGNYMYHHGTNSVYWYSSVDGLTWERTSHSLPSTNIFSEYESSWPNACIASDGDKLVAVSNRSYLTAYTVDGDLWVESHIGSCDKRAMLVYGNGMFVALPSSSSILWYSTDGITWSESKMPVSGNWSRSAYGGGKFVAINLDTGEVAYSLDGINWSLVVSNVQAKLLDINENDVTSEYLPLLPKPDLKINATYITISGKHYPAEEGMYWVDWLFSSYNRDNYSVDQIMYNQDVVNSTDLIVPQGVYTYTQPENNL